MGIGLYDVPDQAQLESHPVAADGYDEYIRGAQEAEHMGAVLLVDRLGSLFLTLSDRPFSTHYLKVGTRESPTDDDTGRHRPPPANPARLTHPPRQGHRGAAATTATGCGGRIPTVESGDAEFRRSSVAIHLNLERFFRVPELG